MDLKKPFTQGNFTMAYISQSFSPKKNAEMRQQINLRQNIVCWKQQIYPSPENFTPALLVGLETYKMSASSPHHTKLHWNWLGRQRNFLAKNNRISLNNWNSG